MRIAAAGQNVLTKVGSRVLARVIHEGTAIALNYRLSGRGSILVFHEVHDDPRTELGAGCSNSALENLIRLLRETGTDFVTMDEALARLDAPQSRPFVTVTFDDGYRDTYQRALPVLQRLDVPSTIYVPTHAVTRELYAWWLGLRMLFKKQDVVTIDALNRRFLCSDVRSKIAALMTVTTWVGHDFRRKHTLRPMFNSNGVSLEALSDKYFLNAKELQELAHHPLVTIGAHSTSHAALSTLSSEEMETEISDNRNFLQNLIGRAVSHFAYPYGTDKACGDREFAATNRLGFKSATTTDNRSVADKNSKHALPRLDLTGRFWTTKLEQLATAENTMLAALSVHDGWPEADQNQGSQDPAGFP